MKPSPCDLFVFVGEHSADLHGEAFLKALKALDPSVTIAAVAGPRMRKVGVDRLVMPMENFQVMGFVDVLLALPKLLFYFYKIKKTILTQNFKACLFIDYPGFNLRMESSLKKAGYAGKLLHYICPTVWAWKKSRIHTMVRSLDKLFVILPFEKEVFSPYPLEVEYLGHPLTERLSQETWLPLEIPKDKKVIAVFPGSRKKEIKRNFPAYLRTFSALKKEHPDLLMAISIADEGLKGEIEKILEETPLEKDSYLLLPAKDNYRLMKSAYFAIAKSGTVNLELALLGVPTVVTYAISKIDVFLAKKIFKINLPYYSLPNLLLKKEIFTELFGPYFTEEALLQAVRKLFQKEKREEIKLLCSKLKELLGTSSPSEHLAKSVLTLIKR